MSVTSSARKPLPGVTKGCFLKAKYLKHLKTKHLQHLKLKPHKHVHLLGFLELIPCLTDKVKSPTASSIDPPPFFTARVMGFPDEGQKEKEIPGSLNLRTSATDRVENCSLQCPFVDVVSLKNHIK